MDSLSEFSYVVSVCCVACAILSLLFQTGRMSKILSLVLSLFVLCSMIVPFVSVKRCFNMDFDIEQYKPDLSVYNKDYNDLVLSQTADNLVRFTDEILHSEGISADNIKLSLKLTEDNSIYVSSVIIYINKDYQDKIYKITDLVSENLLKEPEIVIND